MKLEHSVPSFETLMMSGAKVVDVTERQLPRLADLDPDLVPGLVPDLVTVAIGGNDVIGYDRARFEAEHAEAPVVARWRAGLAAMGRA